LTQAVVFDLDGVLLQSEEVWDAVRERYVRERGGRYDEEGQRAMMGMSAPEWSRYLHDEAGVPDDPDAINRDVGERMLEAYRRELPLLPGAIGAVRDAFNVRFDLYAGAMLENRSNANYAPAENVRKGYVGGGSGPNACGARPATNWPIGSPPAQATGLPLDRTWPLMGGRMGDGDWDFETYWQVNHGGAGREVPVLAEGPAGNSNRPSRYTVYRYEIERGYVGDRSFGGETGTPACYAGAEAPAAPDRRIIHAAVLNCLSLGVGEAAQTNIPVAAFTKFFMTLPMAPSQTDLYVETLGFVTPGDGTRDFEMVQLHR